MTTIDNSTMQRAQLDQVAEGMNMWMFQKLKMHHRKANNLERDNHFMSKIIEQYDIEFRSYRNQIYDLQNEIRQCEQRIQALMHRNNILRHERDTLQRQLETYEATTDDEETSSVQRTLTYEL